MNAERTVWLSCLMYCVKHHNCCLRIFNQEGQKLSPGWTKSISGLPPHSFWLFLNYFFSCSCSGIVHCNREGAQQPQWQPQAGVSPWWHWRDTWPKPGHQVCSPPQPPLHLTLALHNYTAHLLNSSFRKQQRAEKLKPNSDEETQI